MNIIDFHTHIFPDKIARQALASLAEDSGEYIPRTDGTLKGLLASMDHAGINASVVANIATRPAQMLPIFDFSRHIAGTRVTPLISVHPGNSMAEVNTLFLQAAAAGIRGVKLHPMYQEFFIDDRKMYPLYQLIEHFGFFVVFHTGYDIAFPGNTQADVERVVDHRRRVPRPYDRNDACGRLAAVGTGGDAGEVRECLYRDVHDGHGDR